MASPVLKTITGPVLLATLLLVQARVPPAFLVTWALSSSCSDSFQPALPDPFSPGSFSGTVPQAEPLVLSVIGQPGYSVLPTRAKHPAAKRL